MLTLIFLELYIQLKIKYDKNKLEKNQSNFVNIVVIEWYKYTIISRIQIGLYVQNDEKNIQYEHFHQWIEKYQSDWSPLFLYLFFVDNNI
jgi:hypothetical protein